MNDPTFDFVHYECLIPGQPGGTSGTNETFLRRLWRVGQMCPSASRGENDTLWFQLNRAGGGHVRFLVRLADIAVVDQELHDSIHAQFSRRSEPWVRGLPEERRPTPPPSLRLPKKFRE